MNLHTFNNLNDNSSDLTDFKTFLHYSLSLYNSDTDLLISINPDTRCDYIEAIFEKCHEVCSPLFHRSSPYYFFGPTSSTFSDIQGLETIYPELNMNNTFWTTAIKYQCIISSLITLIHFNTSQKEITPYILCNKFKGNCYFSLLDEKILFIDKKELTFSSYKKTGKSAEYSSVSSNFINTFRTFYSNLSANEKRILGIKSEKRVFLFNADLIFRLYKVNKDDKLCKKINKFYENSNTSFSFNHYFELSTRLKENLVMQENSTALGYSFNRVDELLLRYKLERYYNFSLNSCIIESITNLSTTKSIYEPISFNSIPLEVLLTTFNLPNVFSRNGFFKFALYSFNNTGLNSSTFYRRNKDAGPMDFAETSPNEINHLTVWIDLYKKFTTFFSYIIFPIYERCFFIILKENLTHKHNIDFDFINEAIMLLKEYIDKNHDHILTYEGNEYKHKLPDNQLEYDKNCECTKELFGNQNSLIPKLQLKNASEINSLNVTLKNILIHENCIIHPKPSFSLNPEYLGFIPGESAHRKLMNLIVESLLNKY